MNRHLDAEFSDKSQGKTALPEDVLPSSKTQRKREMADLQALGEDLAAQSVDFLRKLALPETLYYALTEARRMTRQDEARRRQIQYIGKLMRRVDANPLREALAQLRGQSASETARLHRLEEMRTRLLDDEQVLQEIIDSYPHADRQYLRALRRSALRERALNKPPASFRALFQVLKQLEDEV